MQTLGPRFPHAKAARPFAGKPHVQPLALCADAGRRRLGIAGTVRRATGQCADRVGWTYAIVGAACADARLRVLVPLCSSLIRCYGDVGFQRLLAPTTFPLFQGQWIAGNGSVQRMGDHAALANRFRSGIGNAAGKSAWPNQEPKRSVVDRAANLKAGGNQHLLSGISASAAICCIRRSAKREKVCGFFFCNRSSRHADQHGLSLASVDW